MPPFPSDDEDWAKKIEHARDAREGQKKLRAGKPVIFTWQRELRWSKDHS